MRAHVQELTASEAAKRLGVTVKALRLYEQSGLVVPRRSAAGYRMYRSDDMARAAEVVAFRDLGLSLAQVVRVMAGDAEALASALTTHAQALDDEIRALMTKRAKVGNLRAGLQEGRMPGEGELRGLVARIDDPLSFDLPWPWCGEQFVMHDIRPINYIVGALGSGKTRLAMRIAQTLPSARFIGLGRLNESSVCLRSRLDGDSALKERVNKAIEWIREEGAVLSDALLALLVALEADASRYLVVDMVEQGLCETTQQALMRYLQRPGDGDKPILFLMTRSSAILDLSGLLSDACIIYCPANHSPPVRVLPYVNAPGFEALADCLTSPYIRERVGNPQPISIS